MTEDQLITLLETLIDLPKETEWFDFKHNNYNHEEIGEYISALSNSATLHGRDRGYVIWGVDDKSHRVLGTNFKPKTAKIGGEELENWLIKLIFPKVNFIFHEFKYNNYDIVVLEIFSANHTPIRFKENEFIRVGSYKKKLKEHPEKERELWQKFQSKPFEKLITINQGSFEKIMDLIDYPKMFDLLQLPLPDSINSLQDRLIKEEIIVNQCGEYKLTNLGAILFARNLNDFETLRRKTIRVITYKNSNRVETIREEDFVKGYATSFESILDYIDTQIPRNEEIGKALRKEVQMYPPIAVRELVANALIHQDFNLSGTGTMIEIFCDRIEITNPGKPLIDTLRFIDEPPRSRNEIIASLMRRMNICEERGSGIDKVIFHVEAFQLPAPDFQVTDNHIKSVLYAHKKYSQMDTNDRIRACYQHACLCWVSNQKMTNTSLRKRFGFAKENYPMASRIIKETLEKKLIKPYDPSNTSNKNACYVPFWA